jgi:hypothetical protein
MFLVNVVAHTAQTANIALVLSMPGENIFTFVPVLLYCQAASYICSLRKKMQGTAFSEMFNTCSTVPQVSEIVMIFFFNLYLVYQSFINGTTLMNTLGGNDGPLNEYVLYVPKLYCLYNTSMLLQMAHDCLDNAMKTIVPRPTVQDIVDDTEENDENDNVSNEEDNVAEEKDELDEELTM